jgi:hypothetical protein
MALLIRTWHLANGLKVEILDETVSYYGDYSTIKLIVRCRIEVKEEHLRAFLDNPLYRRVARALGRATEYRREITKSGVPARNLAAVKSFLVERFEENALGYFEREDFPERFVCKKFTEISEELAKKEGSRQGDGD